MRLFPLSVAALLTGCAGAPPAISVTRTVVVHERVPEALLTCAGAPTVPAATLQSQVATYVIRLHAAWADCSQTVAAIRNFSGKP
jgi:hypothetical protein